MEFDATATATATALEAATNGLSGEVPLPPHDPGDLTRKPDIKIILLGDSAVGKSKLLERFLVQSYCERTASTYALSRYIYDYKDPETKKSYLVDFWDTAGQEQFEKLHPSFYYQANCAILAFDVTRKVTYRNLDAWWEEMRKYCPDVPALCIGNKIDSDPKCTGRTFKFSERHQLPFHFVSAADGTNVARVFSEAIALAIANKENPPDEDLAEMYRLLEAESPLNATSAMPSLVVPAEETGMIAPKLPSLAPLDAVHNAQNTQ